MKKLCLVFCFLFIFATSAYAEGFGVWIPLKRYYSDIKIVLLDNQKIVFYTKKDNLVAFYGEFLLEIPKEKEQEFIINQLKTLDKQK